MPHYVILVNFTDQGVKSVRDLPKMIQANNQRAAAAGIKIQRFFTLGQYDLVAIVEAPNDETLAMTNLAIGGQGNLRTTTLKAFTESEFLGLIGRLPS